MRALPFDYISPEFARLTRKRGWVGAVWGDANKHGPAFSRGYLDRGRRLCSGGGAGEEDNCCSAIGAARAMKSMRAKRS